jgi:hypothetical protein
MCMSNPYLGVRPSDHSDRLILIQEVVEGSRPHWQKNWDFFFVGVSFECAIEHCVFALSMAASKCCDFHPSSVCSMRPFFVRGVRYSGVVLFL